MLRDINCKLPKLLSLIYYDFIGTLIGLSVLICYDVIGSRMTKFMHLRNHNPSEQS